MKDTEFPHTHVAKVAAMMPAYRALNVALCIFYDVDNDAEHAALSPGSKRKGHVLN